MSRGWVTSFALLAGCAGAGDVYVPTPDPVAGAATAIVFVQDADGADATVVEVAERAWELSVARWGSRPPEAATLTVAFYADDLAALGVPLGALSPAGTEARPCRLATPLAVRSTQLEDGTPTEWSDEGEALPPAMTAHLLGRSACAQPDLCAHFEPRVIELPGSGAIEILLPIDDDTALVGDSRGVFWLASSDGTYQPLAEMSGLPGRGGAIGPDGRIWLVGSKGAVAQGRLGGDFATGVIDEALTLTDVDVDASGAAVIVGVSTSTASDEQVVLLTEEPGGWREAGRITVPETSLKFTRVRWMAPGQALATYAGPSLLFYSGGTVREQFLGFTGPIFDLEINDVFPHPELGALFVANDGRVYEGEPPYDAWLALEGAEIGVEAHVGAPYGPGVVFGGVDGAFRELVPGSAPCPEGLLVGSNAQVIAQVGARLLVSGEPQESGFDNSITWLDPRPRSN